MSAPPISNPNVRQHAAHLPVSPGPRPRHKWRWITMVAVLLLAATAWESAHRVGLGTASGEKLSSIGAATKQSSGANTRIRLGTFNIHGGKGLDNRRDLQRIAAEIADLDFVGLNEVEGPFGLEEQNQAEELAARLNLSWLFAPAERRWWHYDFGNGALTSLPITAWQRIPLPRAHGKGFRNLVLLRSEFGGRPLNLLVTHIDRSDDRERSAQLRFVADIFLSLAEPAVLMGDMNSDDQHPELRRLLDTPGVVDPLVAIHGDDFPRHIDWIFLRGLTPRDAGLNEAGPSDHPAVWTEVELTPASE